MKTVEVKCHECGKTYRCSADSQAESSELCAECWRKKEWLIFGLRLCWASFSFLVRMALASFWVGNIGKGRWRLEKTYGVASACCYLHGWLSCRLNLGVFWGSTSNHTVHIGGIWLSEIELFTWRKQDLFCESCGKKIGRWAKKHSGKCQSCNLKSRMELLKSALQRVSQWRSLATGAWLHPSRSVLSGSATMPNSPDPHHSFLISLFAPFLCQLGSMMNILACRSRRDI